MQTLIDSDGLALFKLSEAAIDLFRENKNIYHKAASTVVNKLYDVFFDNKQEILGINHRLKSETSMREKIIRRKFYKAGKSPEMILNAIPDMIGVMVECEFIQNEKTLFKVIEAYFNQKHKNGFFYNEKFEDLFVDLDMPQPIKQKNGNELYKLDCFYLVDGLKVNLELQIKSLVNSFWSEVEHNIVYKNNYYLPGDNYINEMMGSVRMNLLGLDKILSLISERINALNSFTIMKDLELSESLATQLISDLLNEKMFHSLGFTTDMKTIRDLLTMLLIRKAKQMETSEAFYKYLDRFKTLQTEELCFNKKIEFERPYRSDSIFKQTLGDKLILSMNVDFEWHSFFVMYFHIHEGRWIDSFDDFLSELETLYLSEDSFARLKNNLSENDLQTIKEETGMHIAKALCQITEYGVQKIKYYEKALYDLHGFMKYTLNCIDNMTEWKEKKIAFLSVINKVLTYG